MTPRGFREEGVLGGGGGPFREQNVVPPLVLVSPAWSTRTDINWASDSREPPRARLLRLVYLTSLTGWPPAADRCVRAVRIKRTPHLRLISMWKSRETISIDIEIGVLKKGCVYLPGVHDATRGGKQPAGSSVFRRVAPAVLPSPDGGDRVLLEVHAPSRLLRERPATSHYVTAGRTPPIGRSAGVVAGAPTGDAFRAPPPLPLPPKRAVSQEIQITK